jgi:hypothetical protein
MSNNPQQHNNDEEARRRYLVETFGPDVALGLPDTTPPGVTRSAQEHAREPMAATHRRKQAEALALVQQVAEEEAEDTALALAIRKMKKGGGHLPPGTLEKAGRAAARRGFTAGSSVDRLVAMAGAPSRGDDVA